MNHRNTNSKYTEQKWPKMAKNGKKMAKNGKKNAKK